MRLIIKRSTDTVEVAIMEHKGTNKYSYVNLTKQHICPCVFNSVAEALEDLNRYENIISYEVVDN